MISTMLAIAAAASPSGLPAGCRYAAASDMEGIRITKRSDYAVELPSAALRRATGFRVANGRDEVDSASAMISIVNRSDKLGNPCRAFRWKVVPTGPHPVDARDFTGGRLPTGTAVLPSDEAGTAHAYIRVRARDDFRSEPKETYAIQIVDEQDRVIWGTLDSAPFSDRRVSDQADAKGVTVTLLDTERQCLTPAPSPPYAIRIEATDAGYQLTLEGPQQLERCADVSWSYLGDNIPDPDPDAEIHLSGVARFTADDDAIGFTGSRQSFPLFAYAPGLAGRKVRIAWGLSSPRPALAVLTIPPRPKR